jgi:hypothetical protein
LAPLIVNIKQSKSLYLSSVPKSFSNTVKTPLPPLVVPNSGSHKKVLNKKN